MWDHVRLFSGVSYTAIFVPNGAIGCALKSYSRLWNPSYADLVGSVRHLRSKFRVILTCGIASSHKVRGHSSCAVASVAMIWFLASLIARSAMLRRWLSLSQH